MNKTIYDISLLDLLPPNLRDNPDIIAASQILDNQYHEIANKINSLVFVDTDNIQDEALLDMLAIERNVDSYDQSLPIENKRNLVKNAYLYKYRKGTAFVVAQLVTDAF
jgi:P2-related tail formation protein